MTRLLTADDLQIQLSCSISMIYNLAKEELKPDVMLFGPQSRRGMRWHQESVDLYVAKHTTKQEETPDFNPIVFPIRRKKVA